ncbi:Nse1 non-SMC component of SMC5-6 complex-domain-containing protein [Gloeopeniophorella convolvens]|nr:Nse1 non-SMC component of SMC5-6 complex-domain-containing protein [Gloeopeniophorella convolvens]
MVSSNDVQRLFLQSVISRRVLSADLAKALWKQSVAAVKAADETLRVDANGTDGWDTFIAAVNRSLDPLDLEFSHIHNEVTGKDIYALVNRRDDEIAQIASDYSGLEISYFKALVEQIMLAPNSSYSISSLAALREVNSLKSQMTKTQAENVLNSFVAKGWLLKSKKGRFSLAPRALLELQPYLKSTYPEEILECIICHEILTRGHACPRANCGVRIHNNCYDLYRKSSAKCPACSEDWGRVGSDKVTPIGEAAAPKDDWTRPRRRRSVAASEESAEEEILMEEEGPSQAQDAAGNGEPEAAMEVDEDEEPVRPKRRGKGRRG